jgi:nucleoside diphosphate kinase
MLYQYLIKSYGFGYDVNHPKLIPITEEATHINLILLKPNSLKGRNLRIIVDCLKKHDSSITLDSCSDAMRIPDRLFEGLYPSAANGKRRFSKHWFEYMTSDNIVLFVLRGNLSYHAIRNACLEARKISNIEWTKNIVHSAESDEEYDLFFELVIETCRTHPRLQPYSPINYNDKYSNFIADYFETVAPNKKQKC